MTDRPGRRNAFDLDALLNPSQAFTHPTDVLNDHDLTRSEKRAILSSWASRAAEAAPSDVMDALRALDGDGDADRYQRLVRRRALFGRGRPEQDERGSAA